MPTTSSSVSSPEDVINLALAEIGYQQRIGSVWEGSRAAKVALDLYSETRDEVLRSRDWGFSRTEVELSVLKSAPAGGYGSTAWAPTYPPLPWLYEYSYPADCIRMRYLQQAAAIPNYDPQPVYFTISNDPAYGQKTILANKPNLIAVYTSQITDMTMWEPLFVMTLVKVLSRKFMTALNLAAGQPLLESLKLLDEEAKMAIGIADQAEEH